MFSAVNQSDQFPDLTRADASDGVKLTGPEVQTSLTHPFPIEQMVMELGLSSHGGPHQQVEFLIQESGNRLTGQVTLCSNTCVWLAGAYETGPDLKRFNHDYAGTRRFELANFSSFRVMHGDYPDTLNEGNLARLQTLVGQGETGLTLKYLNSPENFHGVLVGLSSGSMSIMRIEDQREFDTEGRDVVHTLPLGSIEAFRYDFTLPHAMNQSSIVELTASCGPNVDRFVGRLKGTDTLIEGMLTDVADEQVALRMVYERSTQDFGRGRFTGRSNSYPVNQISAFDLIKT